MFFNLKEQRKGRKGNEFTREEPNKNIFMSFSFVHSIPIHCYNNEEKGVKTFSEKIQFIFKTHSDIQSTVRSVV